MKSVCWSGRVFLVFFCSCLDCFYGLVLLCFLFHCEKIFLGPYDDTFSSNKHYFKSFIHSISTELPVTSFSSFVFIQVIEFLVAYNLHHSKITFLALKEIFA